MKVEAVKTHKITARESGIFEILDRYLPLLEERTVVAVTSKIIALCEGRVLPLDESKKDDIIVQEAEWYLPRSSSKYNVMMTIKGSGICFSSGVDESNANGYFVLWPKDPQQSANEIREHLVKKHRKKDIGVIITDTTSVPLRWGQRGVFALAHSGFSALNSYIGKFDLFGRQFKMTSAAVSDALAATAVLIMGEGAECTPLAIFTELPFVAFQRRNPTQREINKLKMNKEDDLFTPLLEAVPWKKGGSTPL
ncbi:MAG: coenzyme F420-0:L-glutamate ligase [Candidatus Wildermuthbacteria bacterium]|nr:coenzyme F420-0:L-glutamate ligase [Candidatus Wildermuthbacteria bacterium]